MDVGGREDARDRIRILQVVDKFSIDGRSIHGVARLLSWWAQVLDQDRYEMVVLGLDRPSPAGRYLEEQGATVFYSDRGKLNPATILDILNVGRKTRADVLHLHGYKASTFGRIAGQLSGTPVIVHEHAVFPTIPPYQKLADRLLAPLSDRVVVNCDAVAEFCKRHRAMRGGDMEVVFNGIPLEDFRAVTEEEIREVARELRLDPDAPTVGTVARLDAQKGVSYLLRAVPLIRARVPGLQVLIVGDGTLRDELGRQARDLGVEDAVLFTGERRDVPRLYGLMDVKVISSLFEGTTLTVFEAWAVGTPVVATAVDGVAEVIQDEVTGLLVPPRDPAAIAEAVAALLLAPDRAREISERARRAVAAYEIRTSMRRIEQLYDDVLEARQGTAVLNSPSAA